MKVRIYAPCMILKESILSNDGIKNISKDDLFYNNVVHIDVEKLKHLMKQGCPLETHLVNNWIEKYQKDLEATYTKVKFFKKEELRLSTIVIGNVYIIESALYIELSLEKNNKSIKIEVCNE